MRSMTAGRVQAFSAGTESTFVCPLAIEAMAEDGIDISRHHSHRDPAAVRTRSRGPQRPE